MRVLHVIASMDPKYGGPAEGLRQYCRTANELGHQFEIASLDPPSAGFARNVSIPLHTLGPAYSTFWYGPRLARWLDAHAGQYDALVIHGLWQYHSIATRIAARRRGTPYFVFPHGMLGPWFKHTYPLKHYKKWLTWPWADYRVLRDAHAVLFTCQQECVLASQSFWLYAGTPRVVGFGVAPPPPATDEAMGQWLARAPAARGKRILLFLSRLHPVKGCDGLLEGFARADTPADAHLVIAGPDSAGLQATLQAQARSLGIEQRVSWVGAVHGEAKWAALRSAELFVLPSHHENFGVAIVEALACGTPGLISHAVNTAREIARHGAAIVEADSAAGVRKGLERWFALTANERPAWRTAARRCYDAEFTTERATARLVQTLGEAMGNGAHAARAPIGDAPGV